MPAHDCDTTSVEAIVTSRGSLHLGDMRTADKALAGVFVLRVSTTSINRSDPAVPWGSPGSAFLNPLRV